MNTYSLLDFGSGKRLEKWGAYTLIRPDPTATDMPRTPKIWESADACYRGEKGKGYWEAKTKMPEKWLISMENLHMYAKLTPYKHTGIFPEQAANWEWMRREAALSSRNINVLNLFAYTGGATIALAKDGQKVTHVDSSKPAIRWAKENARDNGIAPDCIRWMLEDVPTFVHREFRRGKKYDAIVLDPPAYGHGAGKTWRVQRDLSALLKVCVTLLSSEPSFLLLNGYAKQDTPESFQRLLRGIFSAASIPAPTIIAEELFLKTPDNRSLSTGIVAKCAFAKRS